MLHSAEQELAILWVSLSRNESKLVINDWEEVTTVAVQIPRLFQSMRLMATLQGKSN